MIIEPSSAPMKSTPSSAATSTQRAASSNLETKQHLLLFILALAKTEIISACTTKARLFTLSNANCLISSLSPSKVPKATERYQPVTSERLF